MFFTRVSEGRTGPTGGDKRTLFLHLRMTNVSHPTAWEGGAGSQGAVDVKRNEGTCRISDGGSRGCYVDTSPPVVFVLLVLL